MFEYDCDYLFPYDVIRDVIRDLSQSAAVGSFLYDMPSLPFEEWNITYAGPRDEMGDYVSFMDNGPDSTPVVLVRYGKYASALYGPEESDLVIDWTDCGPNARDVRYVCYMS